MRQGVGSSDGPAGDALGKVRRAFAAACLLASLAAPARALAQAGKAAAPGGGAGGTAAPSPQPAPSPSGPGLTLELNKLEPAENACRASFVLTNPGEIGYDSLKLDLVSFQPDGVIGQRLLVELAPVPPQKTLVKAFDFEGVGCDSIARILVNEVVACRTDRGEVDPPACLKRLGLEALTARLWK
ncbi:MAG: hypothetical protein KDG89_15160 [Geminicoccaceae bacterium]|nr:hypothetical protein [Geminicoccaceae bacterium]